jgi:hypothetical protein
VVTRARRIAGRQKCLGKASQHRNGKSVGGR